MDINVCSLTPTVENHGLQSLNLSNCVQSAILVDPEELPGYQEWIAVF